MPAHRKTKTEDRIRAALTHLLREKGLDGLTVSDVAREAGINRGTFYAHYTDKLDLVQKQIDSVAAELSDILLTEPRDTPTCVSDVIPYDRVLEALRYVYENHEFIGALTDDGRDMRLQSYVKDVLAELIERQLERLGQAGPSYCGLPQSYGREALLSCTVSVIWLWLRRGCAEAPEEIASIIFRAKDIAPCELLR